MYTISFHSVLSGEFTSFFLVENSNRNQPISPLGGLKILLKRMGLGKALMPSTTRIWDLHLIHLRRLWGYILGFATLLPDGSRNLEVYPRYPQVQQVVVETDVSTKKQRGGFQMILCIHSVIYQHISYIITYFISLKKNPSEVPQLIVRLFRIHPFFCSAHLVGH